MTTLVTTHHLVQSEKWISSVNTKLKRRLMK